MSGEDFSDELQNERQKTRSVFEVGEKFGLSFKERQCFDFFFYAENENDANNLAIELHKLGYQVDVHGERELRKHRWSITGTTPEIDTDLDHVTEWSGKMFKLASSHHAEFDGWGSGAS